MKTRTGFTSILTAFALSGVVLVSGCTSSGQGYTDEATHLEHLPTLRGHSMGQSGSFGQARRAVRYGVSGKRRNAADEPLWPIE